MARPDRPDIHSSSMSTVGATRMARYVVGIVGADEPDSIEAVFTNLPAGLGVGCVVVHDLPLDRELELARELERRGLLTVRTPEDGIEVEADSIYLIPGGRDASILERRLAVATGGHRSTSQSVDRFLRSLAVDRGPCAIGVQLGRSATGLRGLRAIRLAGGLSLIHGNPVPPSLPSTHTWALGVADLVLPAHEIGPAIGAYCKSSPGARSGLDRGPTHRSLEPILAVLRRAKGADVRCFSPRRVLEGIRRRMCLTRAANTHDYHTRLISDWNELDQLFYELTVHPTEFCEDPATLEELARCLPEIASLADGGRVRAWVPGCGTGEEAYSLAMVLADVAEDADVAGEIGGLRGFGIVATDLAPEAIESAASGSYPIGVREFVDRRLLEEYFERDGKGYRATQDLRDRIAFCQHDFRSDPPLRDAHVVWCRNLLRWLGPPSRAQVLARLHEALVPGGFLVLHPDDELGELEDEFEVASRRGDLLRKRAPDRDEPKAGRSGAPPALPEARAAELGRACAQMIEEHAPTCLALDRDGHVVHRVGQAEPYLRIPSGRPTLDIRWMLSPATFDVLSAAMTEARDSGREVHEADVPCGGDPETEQVVQLTVRHLPASGAENGRELYLALFADRHARGDGARHRAQQRGRIDRLSMLERELQLTKKSLSRSLSTLERTNEELSRSNLDLQATNKELQTVNDELYRVNSECQSKIDELTQLSDDMENLLRSTEIGTVFLDRELRIRSYTPQVGDIVSILPTDIGRPIRDLADGLWGVDLDELTRSVVATGRAIEQETTDAQGTARLLRVLPYASAGETDGAVITLIDITRIKDAQRSLARSEERFQELVERLDQVFWTTVPDGSSVEYVSPLGQELFRVPLDAMHRTTEAWFEHVPEQGRDEVVRRFHAGLARGDLDLEFVVLREDGSERWIHAKGFPMPNATGATARVVGFARDITDLKEQQRALEALAQELEDKAHTDALTSLKNRRGLEVELTRELSRARRKGHRITAVLIDLDDFKRINDTLGHATGDVVLSSAAERMQTVLRPSDSLARLGGDEFLALLPETRLTEAVRVAERLRLAVADETIAISGDPLHVTACLGVAVIPPETVSIEEVLDGTRQALSAGKQSGKDRVIAATDSSGNRLSHIQASEPEVQGLTSDGAIRAVCQPIRRLDTNEIYGYEMLSRGPEGPYELPSEFLRLSLEKNVLNLVDLQCFRACVRGSTELNGAGAIHVNLYPSTLVDTPVDRIVQLLREHGGPDRFCIELSEQLFLGAPQYLVEAVKELRGNGVRIALDDVGFGRSSIEALVLLEPDVIKLALEFVRGCDARPRRRAGLERLVRAAKTLSSVLIAEGVESPGERNVLTELGVPFAQGFLWDRPAVPHELVVPS